MHRFLSIGPWLLASTVGARAEPGPETIQDTVMEVLARDAYHLDPPSGLRVRLNWLFDLFEWFYDAIDALLSPLDNASLAMNYFFIIALVLILIGLLAHMGYTLYGSLKLPCQASAELPPDARPEPDTLVKQARAQAGNGRYDEAIRTLSKAALLRLELYRGGRMHVGFTMTEYLQSFRTPWVRDNLMIFADAINWKWYGGKALTEEDFARCEEAYAAIAGRLEAPASPNAALAEGVGA